METRIQKWGNSHAIRLPINFLNNLGIKENDKVIIEEKDNSIVLSKPKHRSIEERISNYKGDYECSEFNSSDIKGNEIW